MLSPFSRISHIKTNRIHLRHSPYYEQLYRHHFHFLFPYINLNYLQTIRQYWCWKSICTIQNRFLARSSNKFSRPVILYFHLKFINLFIILLFTRFLLCVMRKMLILTFCSTTWAARSVKSATICMRFSSTNNSRKKKHGFIQTKPNMSEHIVKRSYAGLRYNIPTL